MRNIIGNLSLGIASSLIAGALLFITATWRSKTIRRALTAVASTFLNVQLRCVHNTGKEAEPSIKADLSYTSDARIITSRGLQFQQTLYGSILDGVNKNLKNVRILLPDTNTKENIDWIGQREEEIALFDKAYGKNMLRNQIETSIQFL